MIVPEKQKIYKLLADGTFQRQEIYKAMQKTYLTLEVYGDVTVNIIEQGFIEFQDRTTQQLELGHQLIEIPYDYTNRRVIKVKAGVNYFYGCISKVLDWGSETRITEVYGIADTNTNIEYVAPPYECTFKHIGMLSYSIFNQNQATAIIPAKMFANIIVDYQYEFSGWGGSIGDNVFENSTLIAQTFNLHSHANPHALPNRIVGKGSFKNTYFKAPADSTITEIKICLFQLSKYESIGNETFKGARSDLPVVLEFAFQNASINSLGERMFAEANFPKLSIRSCFPSTCNITRVPNKMFQDYKGDLDLMQAFFYTNIEELPNDIFLGVDYISNMRSMLYGCKLRELTQNMFVNIKLGSDMFMMLGGCLQLTTVADDLLDYCLLDDNTNIGSLFANCTSLISAPKLWLKPYASKFTNHTGCYSNCTALPWYDEIPADWK